MSADAHIASTHLRHAYSEYPFKACIYCHEREREREREREIHICTSARIYAYVYICKKHAPAGERAHVQA